MRYLITGGGTGGHIYPALTIASALAEMDEAAEILYVGTQSGREATLVPRAGIRFVTISSAGMVNLSFREKIAGGFKVLKGVRESLGHIRRFRPDVVVGTGGFVSGPVLFAARLAKKPVVIQEQNAFPGVTNRMASKWARQVFVPYEEAEPYFPEGAKLQIVGNPVRREMGQVSRAQGRKAFGYEDKDRVLVVMGGSGGARDFHSSVVSAVKILVQFVPEVKVLHITGERYLEQVQEQYGNMAGVSIVPYIHNMPEAYAAADAGVFRSGALTLAEIQVCGLPAVLIPSPNVTHNHQEWNARTLEKRGAAVVVREEEMSAEQLSDAMLTVLTDREQRRKMQQALGELADPEAAGTIAKRIVEIAREG